MKKIKKATSIVEALIVMLVIVTWVTWMYNIFIKSTDLSNSTTNKVQAIQIASQWIEWIINIRDTNWLIFSSDYKNCWTTLNYNSSCIWWDGDNSYKIQNNWKYIIYQNSDNRWELSSTGVTTDYTSPDYRNFFKVWLNNWIYTQTWVIDNLKPLFTREIIIKYLQADWITAWDETSPKIKIISLVQRVDKTSIKPHKVEVEQILSNWKK